MAVSQEERMLLARLDDLVRRAETGVLAHSAFLTEEQSARAQGYLSAMGIRAVSFGGYGDAERRRTFILPAYAAELEGDPTELLKSYFSEELDGAIRAIKIKGSGYRELSHRDYLGSLLSLGIEREVIGDIVVDDSFSATVFCSGGIAEFIVSSLERIANDKVDVQRIRVGEDFTRKVELQDKSTTVASARLDCVVSALCDISRGRSQELIKKESCQVDFTVEVCPDRILIPPCKISVRGYGRFILNDFDGQTKKGRLKMNADKYI